MIKIPDSPSLIALILLFYQMVSGGVLTPYLQQMKSTPVIVGLDLGSWSFKLCAFNGQKLEVLTNEANFRQTPSLVGYTPTERLIGEPALIKLKTNFPNTLRAPHRLLALAPHPHLLQEEMRHGKVRYQCGKELVFLLEGREGTVQVAVEEVLLSLLAKAKSIVQSHGLQLAIAYLAVPAFAPNRHKQALLRCAELALDKPVRLVDEWAALAAQYTYSRIKELRQLEQMRNIVFLDIGYSKASISLVQFSRFEGKLVDWEHLPFTGCKNMDERVLQFYDERFQQTHQGSPLGNAKAHAKLLDAVQRQRTVLSANNDHHLVLEYLFNGEDLAYDMKREELETIIVSVLADLAAAMAALQARNSGVLLHAVELMGGASRMPCVQALAVRIFGIEPSRSLNQSEAIATGATVLGAAEKGVLNLQYSYPGVSTKEIGVRWGKQRHPLFSKTSRVPSEVSINVPPEGKVEAIVFEVGVVEKELGRIRFTSPNRLTISLDQNGILRAKVGIGAAQVNFGARQQSSWQELLRREQEMSRADLRTGMIYELRNDYESKLYSSKAKLADLKLYASPQQLQQIEEHLKIAEGWVEEEHSKPAGTSENQLAKYQQKNSQIDILKGLIEQLQGQRRRGEQVRVRYDKLSEEICMALESPLSQKGREQVLEVLNWGQEAYQAMENHAWSTQELTLQKLKEASLIIRNALPK